MLRVVQINLLSDPLGLQPDQLLRDWPTLALDGRWRRTFALARGWMFSAREQAAPFQRRALVPTATCMCEVPESRPHFQPVARDEARRITGLAGEQGLLWVGHLNANKDPLTVLDGIALATQRLPGLQLWMCFGKAPLPDALACGLSPVVTDIPSFRRLLAGHTDAPAR